MTTATRVRGQVCTVCGVVGTKASRVQVVAGLAAHKACRPKRECTRPGCAAAQHASGLCSSHYGKEYYASDPAAQRERVRQWALRNPGKVAARNGRRDKSALAAASRAWYRANRLQALASAHNARALRAGVAGTVTAEQLLGRLSYFGHRCYLCGSEPNGFDHVKPLSAGGLNLAANLRPVCGPCNSHKGQSWKDNA